MEDLDKGAYTPHEYVKETARQKALDVFGKVTRPFESKHGRSPSLVIGADTIVVLDGRILEKPSSVEDARQMLRDLSSAGSHTVYTGVSLLYGSGGPGTQTPSHEHTFFEETTVHFRPLDDADIEAYVATGEPMDKAGGYGIQGLGSAFVTSIVGDYQNVVGFPAARFSQELDTERLAAWVAAAPADAAVAPPVAFQSESFIVDDFVCADADECGLPSD